MSATRVHIVRHGETAANAARILQTEDTPLSEVGLDQARRLARRFAGVRVGLVLASDLRRAVMTAEALHAASGGRVELAPLLQERSFGELRGRAYAELDFDPFARDYEPPGGESWAAFDQRVGRAWQLVEERAASCEGELVVVTHGLVCRSFVSRFDADGTLARGAGGFANTSVSVLGGPPPWRLERIACIEHLAAPDGRGAAERRDLGIA